MHMLRKALGFGLLGSVFAASLAAQRTWVVDQVAGPGVDFTDIPPAVAAAAAGDRIVVRGSTLPPPTYSSFVVTKSLDIEATQGASVYFFRVENLTAGQAARVAGFRCEPRPYYPLVDECVLVRNCAGTVLLANLNIWNRTGEYQPGFAVRDAAAVAIQGCVATGRSAGLTSGGPALMIERSGVSITASTLNGGDGGGSASNAVGYNGGNGIDVYASSVYVANSTLRGAAGGYGWAWSGNGGAAAAVAASPSSQVTLASCAVTRGAGPVNGDAVTGPARVAQDCVVTGALTNGAALVPSMPKLTVSPTVALGGSAVVTIDGSQGSVCLVAFDLRHHHQALVGIAEPLLLSPALVLGSIGVMTSPQFVWSLSIPNSPLLAERDLFFQAGLSSSGIALTPLGATRMR